MSQVLEPNNTIGQGVTVFLKYLGEDTYLLLLFLLAISLKPFDLIHNLNKWWWLTDIKMEEATGHMRAEQAVDAMEFISVEQREDVTGRIVVQQCLHAALKLQAAEGEPPEIVEVIIFVSIF